MARRPMRLKLRSIPHTIPLPFRMVRCCRRRKQVEEEVLSRWVKFTKFAQRLKFKSRCWGQLGNHLREVYKRGGYLRALKED